MLVPARHVIVATLVGALLVVLAPAAGARVRYDWPVDGRPVHAFEESDGPYGRGHRGVDLRVLVGQEVGAMAGGSVSFAGSVAGRRWVTVAHPDGIRTTVGPLASIDVDAGRTVDAGQRLGTASAVVHERTGLLHVSARRGDVYLDPATLVDPGVPTLVGAGDVVVMAGDATARPVLVPGTPPSPNRLVVVGGLASSTQQQPLDPADLGYGPDDTEKFSYAGGDADGPLPYDAADTWQGVHDAALLLREQLRAAQAREPGRAVDLVAHSLGGLVTMYYLLVLHDASDPSFPPVGRVVTIASPLQGTDGATANLLRPLDPVLDALLTLADAAYAPVDLQAPVMDDLVPGSPVVTAVREAWQRAQADPFTSPLATGTDLLAIGALLDPIVPAWRTDLDGMDTHTTMETHGGAPRDPVTQTIVEAFLAGRPLPAGDRLDAVAGILRPATILTSLAEILVALPF